MRRNIGSPLAGRVSSNFGGSVNHRTKKIIAGVLIATLGPLVATTLAASVTIGDGNNLEFGQGSQAAVACDTTITTAITETWYETSTVFQVATIVLSNLDTRAGVGVSNAGCGGKTLKVSLLGSTGTSLTIGSSGTTTSTSVTLAATGVDGSQTVASNGVTASLASAGQLGTLTLTIPTATIHLSAATVYRVAIETS
jgi:hypothetical protein